MVVLQRRIITVAKKKFPDDETARIQVYTPEEYGRMTAEIRGKKSLFARMGLDVTLIHDGTKKAKKTQGPAPEAEVAPEEAVANAEPVEAEAAPEAEANETPKKGRGGRRKVNN